ncbi:MAG: hypothetical protein KIT57_03635 [Blastocatellales bacterium]|nr:hypothetical protein [Blastocatellales bacterium]
MRLPDFTALCLMARYFGERPSRLMLIDDPAVGCSVDLAATLLLQRRDDEERVRMIEAISALVFGSAANALTGGRRGRGGRQSVPAPSGPAKPDPPGSRVIRIRPGQSEVW